MNTNEDKIFGYDENCDLVEFPQGTLIDAEGIPTVTAKEYLEDILPEYEIEAREVLYDVVEGMDWWLLENGEKYYPDSFVEAVNEIDSMLDDVAKSVLCKHKDDPQKMGTELSNVVKECQKRSYTLLGEIFTDMGK